jgi:hypothetical protein
VERPIDFGCAPKAAYLAIITAYLPDPSEWTGGVLGALLPPEIVRHLDLSRIWDRWQRSEADACGKLPPIVPVVLSHAPSGWTHTPRRCGSLS